MRLQQCRPCRRSSRHWTIYRRPAPNRHLYSLAGDPVPENSTGHRGSLKYHSGLYKNYQSIPAVCVNLSLHAWERFWTRKEKPVVLSITLTESKKGLNEKTYPNAIRLHSRTHGRWREGLFLCPMISAEELASLLIWKPLPREATERQASMLGLFLDCIDMKNSCHLPYRPSIIYLLIHRCKREVSPCLDFLCRGPENLGRWHICVSVWGCGPLTSIQLNTSLYVRSSTVCVSYWQSTLSMFCSEHLVGEEAEGFSKFIDVSALVRHKSRRSTHCFPQLNFFSHLHVSISRWQFVVSTSLCFF